jgi:alpha-L-rhamnosidase
MLIERSRNHPMLGSFDAWLYNTIAGISPDPEHPGFAKVILKPHFCGRLSFAKASYRSVRGLISSEWSVRENVFCWRIEMPGNTRAAVHFPVGDYDSITESGRPLADVAGITDIRFSAGRWVCEIENGSFAFAAELRK